MDWGQDDDDATIEAHQFEHVVAAAAAKPRPVRTANASPAINNMVATAPAPSWTADKMMIAVHGPGFGGPRPLPLPPSPIDDDRHEDSSSSKVCTRRPAAGIEHEESGTCNNNKDRRPAAGIGRRNRRCLILLALLVVHIVFAGCVFYAAEHDAEVVRLTAQKEEYDKLSLVWDATDGVCITQAHVDQLKALVSEPDPTDPNWTIPGGTFFATTVFTTIGYGSYTPQTGWGKFLACFFAIFGVAHFGYVLTTSVGERVMTGSAWLATKCFSLSLDRYKKYQLRYLMALSLAYVLLLALCGITFVQWGYGNSIYFSILTFTTVGLGDFVPRFSSGEGKAKMFFMSLFLLVGLALLAGLVGAVTEELKKDATVSKLSEHGLKGIKSFKGSFLLAKDIASMLSQQDGRKKADAAGHRAHPAAEMMMV